MREQRTAEFQQAVDEHRKQLERIADGNESDDKESGSAKESDGGDEEWEGFEEPPAVDYEAEYIDEDKYTTVTVEEMDATREGLLKSRKQENSDEDEETQPDAQEVEQKPDAPPTRAKSTKSSTKPKKKKARFRYESKEDRKINDLKLRMSKKKKAAARREQ
jgi:ribosomal RNA-processing protein 17